MKILPFSIVGLSITTLFVADIPERLTRLEENQVLSEDLNSMVNKFAIVVSRVWVHKHVRQWPKLAIRRQRLLAVHIHHCTGKLSALESCDQVLLVHRLATTNTHENRPRLHLAETVLHREEICCSRSVWQNANHVVSLGIHTFELVIANKLITVTSVLLRNQLRSPFDSDDFCSKHPAYLATSSTYIAVSNEGHSFSRALVNCISLPPALALLLLIQLDFLSMVEHS